MVSHRNLPASRLLLAAAACILLFAAPRTALAQDASSSFDPAKRFRGGIWEQWIYWVKAGPSASKAVNRRLDVVNTERARAGLPPLLIDPSKPLIVAFYEEQDGRGPNGAPAGDSTPNRELFFAAFAHTKDLSIDGVLLLEDPIRSNASLTLSGVPGRAGQCEFHLKRDVDANSNENTKTNWTCRAGPDRIDFSAQYTSAAISFRGRTPSASDYLLRGMGPSLDIIFASRPTELFHLVERNQSAFIDLPRNGVEISLKVAHHDPDINAMFSDPMNLPNKLIEIRHRVVRFERD